MHVVCKVEQFLQIATAIARNSVILFVFFLVLVSELYFGGLISRKYFVDLALCIICLFDTAPVARVIFYKSVKFW